MVALEQAVAAPMASCRLADAGARVIKIERSEGDFARGYDRAGNGGSSYFSWLNRGKESLGARHQGGDRRGPAASTCSSRADVFIQNLAAGAAERAGFGSADLRARYPRLITCDISGYGDGRTVCADEGLRSVGAGGVGPGVVYRARRASLRESAYRYATSPPASARRWQFTRHCAGASVPAMAKALAISLFDVMAEWMTVPLLHYDYLGAAPKNMGMAHPTVAPYGAFSTLDQQT